MSTILIVYEREIEQQALQKLLAGGPHSVVIAGNGIDALDMARRNPPDAIVADFMLPRMDGFALCRKFKHDERLKDVPFIFYTSRRDDPKYERFAIEVGADRFLARPSDSAAVLKAVDEQLALKRARPQPAVEPPAAIHSPAPPPPGATPVQPAQPSAEALQALANQDKLKARIVELEVSKQHLVAGEQQARKSLEDWQETVRTQAYEHAQESQQHQAARKALAELQASNQEQAQKYAQEVQQHQVTQQALAELQASAGEQAEKYTQEIAAHRATREFFEKSAADSQAQARELAREMAQHQQAESILLGNLQRAEVAVQAMIETLVTVSERHDRHTAGSAQRVAALATTLGRELGLDGERQHALRIAGLLHDVGMITVPAEILARPGELTPAERTLIQTHAEAGWDLLRHIDFGGPVAEIVYQHHERLDGKGYPRGLQGEGILLEARILAVADAVDAMCSTRPMRAALNLEQALDEISRFSGTQFDPQVVGVCTRLFRQHGFRWADRAA